MTSKKEERKPRKSKAIWASFLVFFASSAACEKPVLWVSERHGSDRQREPNWLLNKDCVSNFIPT
jgi:hypothetical protein